MRPAAAGFLLLLLLTTACSAARAPVTVAERRPLPVDVEALPVGEDARPRFREIFCAVLAAREPGAGDCSDYLAVAAGEAPGTGAPVDATRPLRGWRLGLVPGYGSDCFAGLARIYADARPRLEALGMRSFEIPVSGLSGSARNARIIRDAVLDVEMAPDDRLVLLGYSKGAPDALEALARYPRLAERVHAVVAVAGAVGGSRLADTAPELLDDLLDALPGTLCRESDRAALRDLSPALRRARLERNPPPPGIAYHSLVTLAERRHISTGLLPSHAALRPFGPFNDGQLLPEDQIIPGGALLGFLRADHWAAAVPIASGHPLLAHLLADENDFPRAALLEAVMRLLDERARRSEKAPARAVTGGVPSTDLVKNAAF